MSAVVTASAVHDDPKVEEFRQRAIRALQTRQPRMACLYMSQATARLEVANMNRVEANRLALRAAVFTAMFGDRVTRAFESMVSEFATLATATGYVGSNQEPLVKALDSLEVGK